MKTFQDVLALSYAGSYFDWTYNQNGRAAFFSYAFSPYGSRPFGSFALRTGVETEDILKSCLYFGIFRILHPFYG